MPTASPIVRPPPPPAPVKIVAHRVRQHGHHKGSAPLHESAASAPHAPIAHAADAAASAAAVAARANPKDQAAATRVSVTALEREGAAAGYAAAVLSDASAAHAHAIEVSKRHPHGVFHVYLVPDTVSSSASKTGLEPNQDGKYERVVAAYQNGAEIHIT
jgi:hypothetical protein